MRCSAPAALALAAGACAAVPTDPPVLDGEAKSFVVVGYSTSYAWPGMLQDMLDEHSEHMGGERVYHVLNA
ncbi:MAG: hypothetical protein O7B99_13625, partial [Planctomycetota bacterium]|nr:hypothetical protein [Planctomycetota bacterium]